MEGNTETNLTMSGADAILRVLEEQGVEAVSYTHLRAHET